MAGRQAFLFAKLAIVCTLLGCAPPRPPVASAVPDAAVASAAADATPTVPIDAEQAQDIAPLATASSDVAGEVAAAPGDNLVVSIDATYAGSLAGFRLIGAQAVMDGGGGPPLADPVPLLDLPAGPFPMTVSVRVPDGVWAVMAMVGAPPNLQALAVPCADGKPKILVFGPSAPPVQTLQLVLHAEAKDGPSGGLASLCTNSQPTSILTEKELIEMPATKNGMAHYLSGLMWGERLWIADSQDGFVSFDFGAGPKPQHGWTLPGGTGCIDIARWDKYVYCSTRGGQMLVAVQQPAGQAEVTAWAPKEPLGFEGLTVLGEHVVLTAHGNGLRAVGLQPPWKEITMAQPALQDAWDVEPLGPQALAVADGTGGLVILDMTAPKAPKMMGKLALPGLAAWLHVAGGTVAIAASGGRLHLVDAKNPSQPQLLSTMMLPDDPHGMTSAGGLLFAAAGHHVYALTLPATGQPMAVRGASRAKHFAMDVDVLQWGPQGGEVLASEFQSVRRLHVAPGQPATGFLVAPPALHVPVATVGSQLQTTLRVDNPGPLPVTIGKIVFVETPSKTADVPGGPWLVPAGGHTDVAVAVAKTEKGVQLHALRIESAAASALVVALNETTALRAGDVLPPLAYQDADGKLVNVQEFLAGKVGVVLVAAESCPVAFVAMTTAAADLAADLAAAKVAVIALNPWDKPDKPETQAVKLPYPVLYTPLSSKDDFVWSELLDGAMGQPSSFGPPMPLVYVVGKDGKIVLAQWGYESKTVLAALQQAQKP